jgi:prophage antirepressor-like protein
LLTCDSCDFEKTVEGNQDPVDACAEVGWEYHSSGQCVCPECQHEPLVPSKQKVFIVTEDEAYAVLATSAGEAREKYEKWVREELEDVPKTGEITVEDHSAMAARLAEEARASVEEELRRDDRPLQLDRYIGPLDS